MNTLLLLQNSPLFKGINASDIEHLLHCFKVREVVFNKDQIIKDHGDHLTEMGFVLEGMIQLERNDYWGNRTIINHISTGEFFGESYASLPHLQIDITILATTKTKVLFIDMDHLLTPCMKGCRFHSQIIRNLVTIVSSKNIILSQKMSHITKRTTRDKILSYLSLLAQKQQSNTIIIPYNRQELADYLSVDRSALSSELSRMQKDGLLTYHKNTFTLNS